jgi:hypothetical protein
VGADEVRDDARSAGHDVRYFAALETDARGLDPYRVTMRAFAELAELGIPADYWTFSLDTGEAEVTTTDRLVRICTGRNLVIEAALRDADVTHILFVDSDLELPGDALSKLLEMDWPIVGGDVPHYGLHGPAVAHPADSSASRDTVRSMTGRKWAFGWWEFPVQEHWNTAGFLLVERHVVRRCRWGTDHHHGGELSDDPWFAERVKQEFGYPTFVRKDVQGHHPLLVPVEQRTADRRWVRDKETA